MLPYDDLVSDHAFSWASVLAGAALAASVSALLLGGLTLDWQASRPTQFASMTPTGITAPKLAVASASRVHPPVPGHGGTEHRDSAERDPAAAVGAVSAFATASLGGGDGAGSKPFAVTCAWRQAARSTRGPDGDARFASSANGAIMRMVRCLHRGW